MEHFNDIRRNKNAIGLTPAIGSQTPQRYLYPQRELTRIPIHRLYQLLTYLNQQLLICKCLKKGLTL